MISWGKPGRVGALRRPDTAARCPYHETGLSQETARWRCRRRLVERFREHVRGRQKLEVRRGNQSEIFINRWEFHSLCLRQKLTFLFGLPGCGDGPADRTGIIAIKGAGHGFGKRVRAQIVREHRRPRDRLQRGPMRAGGGDERHYHENSAEPNEHAGNISHSSD